MLNWPRSKRWCSIEINIVNFHWCSVSAFSQDIIFTLKIKDIFLDFLYLDIFNKTPVKATVARRNSLVCSLLHSNHFNEKYFCYFQYFNMWAKYALQTVLLSLFASRMTVTMAFVPALTYLWFTRNVIFTWYLAQGMIKLSYLNVSSGFVFLSHSPLYWCEGILWRHLQRKQTQLLRWLGGMPAWDDTGLRKYLQCQDFFIICLTGL